MHRLLRYYSQNRIKVWTIILVIIFIIILIHALNNIAKEENKKDNNKEISENDISYYQESESIITGGDISKKYKNDFGEIIDQFYTYCINHEPQRAYDLLAPDTKKVLYKTEQQFENLYYKNKFEGDKQYSFQSWTRSSNDIYIYQVKIFDNMLTTGKRNDEYKEDYVTIVPVDDEYRLNINSYIGRKESNASNKNDLIEVKVDFVDSYMDYEIYTFNIKNNTDNSVMIDTKKNTDTTFVIDDKDNEFESFLYEIAEEDLILKPKEVKKLEIKFNNSYRSNKNIISVNFTDIVDYEDYVENDETTKYSLKIDL